MVNEQEVIALQERIKQVRKVFNLTQAEFGERIGVKGNTVTGYETGIRTPSDAVVKAICREFGVSLEWLKNGDDEKDMFGGSDRDEITAAFGELAAQKDPIVDGFILFLRQRTPEQRKAIAKTLRELVDTIAPQEED